MKWIPYLLTFVLLLYSSRALAQLKVGVTGGANLNNVMVDFTEEENEDDTRLKPGYRVGLTADIPISDKVFFSPAVLFNSKGFSTDGLEGDDYDRYAVNYLEFPINVTLLITERFSAQVGPYFAFGVGGKNTFEFSGEKSELNIEFNDSDIYASEFLATDDIILERLDFGLNLGLGYHVSDKSKLSVGYGWGLNNMVINVVDDIIDNFDDSLNSDDFKIFNRVFSLSLTYYVK